jgi:thiamine kinase-like enzyme
MVAQPLGYNEAVKTIWQAETPGVRLSSIIDQINYKEFLDSVAKGLADLHNSGLFSPVRKTIHDHLRKIEKWTTKLTQAFPPFGKSLQSIGLYLEKKASHLSPISDKLIHGDFDIDQLLVHEGKIVFLDFDDSTIGDPMQDIANFWVDLHFHNFDPRFVKLMLTSFFKSYQSQVGWDAPVDRLSWHIQFQFISWAYKFYIQQKPGLKVATQEIIALAQEAMTLEKVLE